LFWIVRMIVRVAYHITSWASISAVVRVRASRVIGPSQTRCPPRNTTSSCRPGSVLASSAPQSLPGTKWNSVAAETSSRTRDQRIEVKSVISPILLPPPRS
jgi:hypothetical protein